MGGYRGNGRGQWSVSELVCYWEGEWLSVRVDAVKVAKAETCETISCTDL
jgi:hypothetical protein